MYNPFGQEHAPLPSEGPPLEHELSAWCGLDYGMQRSNRSWHKHQLYSYQPQESSQSVEPLSPASGFSPLHKRPTRFLHTSTHSRKSWIQKNFSGWRVGITASAILALVVLLINFSLTIWAVSKIPTDKDGLGTLYKGTCLKTKKMSLWLHLAINILSSILLSASNYCMQTLSAPTRADIDVHHSKRNWMDIGLPSVRNLRTITRRRKTIWWLLLLSSMPLHLMYNSAVFSTLAANEYAIIIGAPEFLDGGPYNTSGYNYLVIDVFNKATSRNSSFRRLEKEDCIMAYKQEFQSSKRDLVIVSTVHNSSNTIFAALVPARPSPGGPNFTGTVCPDRTCQSYRLNTGGKIDYCLSEQVEEKCRLEFSLYIMIIVIFCNLVKAVTMGLVVWKERTPTLVTLGDAISSFMEFPDRSTEGMCLVTKTDILKGAWEKSPTPKMYKPIRHLWFEAVSLKRWLICTLLCGITLGVACYLLRRGILSLPPRKSSFTAIYNMGIGAVTTDSLVKIDFTGHGPGGLLAGVLLANAPQGILSFLYLTYNGIFTCMLNADEWGRFAHQRKYLRVTSPSGKQRSTYYLQLPYTYALPLLALSGTMHWLVSQSIFLARIKWNIRNGKEYPKFSISACGYSCTAIAFAIIVGSVAIFGVIGMGFRRYPAGVPLAGGCSAAISAACHPLPNENVDAPFLPLQWGVVSQGHCSFSAGPVENPQEGYWFSGVRKRLPTVGQFD